jgi:hypothetical protein
MSQFFGGQLRYTSSLLLEICRRGAPMYPDLEALEARFQSVLKEWDKAKSHDEKVQLGRAAKEMAAEYRKRLTDYKELRNTQTETL